MLHVLTINVVNVTCQPSEPHAYREHYSRSPKLLYQDMDTLGPSAHRTTQYLAQAYADLFRDRRIGTIVARHGPK